MQAAELAQRFEHIYRRSPKIFRAPGRVNLIGEHTDYNDGFVMPAAIGFFTHIAIAPRPDRKVQIRSEQFGGDSEFSLDLFPTRKTGSWQDYVLGVAAMLREAGHKISGADILVQGNVPIGAGLSSSAALEVASALAFLSLNGDSMPLPDIARLCQRAENDFVGARCGIMDQSVSCMAKAGHAFFLDCRSLAYELVPIPSRIQLVICNTMVKHDLATGGYNERRAECEQGAKILSQGKPEIRSLRDVSLALLQERGRDLPENVRKRCEHVVRENQRVLDAVACLKAGDLKKLGALMHDSHVSLRDLFEVSCPELDVMVESAHGLPGFYGGRMTGGGFGGCTVNLVQSENAQEFAAQIAQRYKKAIGIDPQVYVSSTADGAHAVEG